MPSIRKIPPPADDEPVGPPAGFPPLTRADVRDRVGDVMLQRGESYVGDAIFDTRRTGRTLKARCQGTAAQPYRVEATIGQRGGVEHDDCTCPVGGRCKHVAALLLAWLEDPDAFVEVQDMETALERRDKAELIALIRQMLARYPEMETLLELPLPVASAHRKPADSALIRREVANAFHGAGDDWGAGANAAQHLASLVQMGDDYAGLGDWRSAATIYQDIVQGVAAHYGEIEDENGDLNEIVNDCVAGLGTCLQAATDPALRQSLLRALFDIYRWDLDLGGIDMGYESTSILLDQANAEERRLIAGWVRAALPEGDAWTQRWRRQSLGGFLLQLAGDQIDDEEFLRISRETGRRRDLVARLLQLGRIDAAESEVRRADDDELLELANLLSRHEQGERAERLVRERLPSPRWHDSYTAWLRDRAHERGDTAAALALSEELFWRRPSLPGYDELKALAQARGSWDALRVELLRRLEREGQQRLLTEIHLREDEVGRALETLKSTTGPTFYGTEPLAIRVAQAAEDDYPREAIALYTTAAERLIQAQGRENYAAAAGYLARVRDLSRRIGEGAAWATLIAGLRDRNRRLRALREELDRAGL